MQIKFVDTRHSIVQKVKDAGFDAMQGDYFDEAVKVSHHVLCSASNPHFTFGGGIDAVLLQHFSFYCKEKQRRLNTENERIGNIHFLVTVDFKLDSNESLVLEALRFIRNNTKSHETAFICGLGTMIGGLDENKFVELLKIVFKV